jgi:nicotinamidase-related amidase
MAETIDPFHPANWTLAPGATALVVIDAQNDFLHPEGCYARRGVDISHMRRSIAPTVQLVEAARRCNVPIVWTRHGFRDQRDAGLFMHLRPFLQEEGLRIGTWGYEVTDEVGARDTDWYVDKNRLSAFYCTNLELILRALSAETVLFAGVLTNQCVAATSKDANFRDLKPIVVEEATGTTLPHLHEPALEMVRVGWGAVRTLEQTLDELAAFERGNA